MYIQSKSDIQEASPICLILICVPNHSFGAYDSNIFYDGILILSIQSY